LISGINILNKFRLEPGIHRVQRVPPTENKGRRHTSTLAVAVLPYDPCDEAKYTQNEFKTECITGQGPGGQHRNKTMSAVKITHISTGLIAYSDTKSQYRNKQFAMTVLLARLRTVEMNKNHSKQNNTRQDQIRDMGRGTKVRTYNFIYNKVSDERIKKKFRVKDIMAGKLDLIYDQVD